MRMLLSRALVGARWTPDAAQGVCPWFSHVDPEDRIRDLDLKDPASPAAVAARWRGRQERIVERARVAGASHVFLKTHSANFDIDELRFADGGTSAAAIHVVRDPRDILISFTNHLGLEIEDTLERYMLPSRRIFDFTDAHAELVGDWAEHVASWRQTRTPPTLLLRYEDIRADPEAAGRRIFQFLDLPLSPNVIADACAATRLDSLKAWEAERPAVAKFGDDRAFFRSGGVGEWRAHPRQDLFRRIEAAFGAEMTALGYPIA